MTNSKQTRRALLSSVVALLVCFSMLLGTTFAWFTDSAASGVNKIMSGNLDIAVYHKLANGEQKEIDGSTDLFDNVNGEPILWEPGASAEETFVIENKGTLALKYRFSINFTNATVHNGKTLADVLKVSYDGGAEEALASASFDGTLTAGETNELTIAIRWPQGANDNDFNVAGGLSIELGIAVVATQQTYEFDSNGSNYDYDATYPDITFDYSTATRVTTADDLKTALLAGNATIVLAEDIDMSGWTSLNAAYKSFKLDGQGHALKNLTVPMFSDLGVATEVIRNVKFENAAINTTGDAAGVLVSYIHGEGGNTLTVENCSVSGSVKAYKWAGGFIGHAGGNPATINFINCTVSDTVVETTDSSAGGLVGHTYNTLNITGCKVIGNSTIKCAEDRKDQSGNAQAAKAGYLVGTVNGNTTTISGCAIDADVTLVNVNALDPMAGGLVGRTAAAGKVSADTETPSTLRAVSTADELMAALNAGGSIVLLNDIDAGNAWASASCSANLQIDGAGHTITGLNCPLLKPNMYGAVTIRNLTIADSTILGDVATEDTLGVGAFCYFTYCGMTFENCHVVNSTIKSQNTTDNGGRAAGLVGYASPVDAGGAPLNISNCSVVACNISAHGSTAGLVAHTNVVTTVKDSKVLNTTIECTEDRAGKAPLAAEVIGTVGGNTTTLTNVAYSGNTVKNTSDKACLSAAVARVANGGSVTIDGAAYVTAAQLKAALTPDADGVITLDRDYILTDTWTPYTIPTGSAYIPVKTGKYTIDGHGHSISGLTAALLGDNFCSGGLTVKNLTIKDSNIAAGGNASGAIVAYMNTYDLTLDNCHLVNSTVGYGYDLQTGGLVGMVTASNMTIKNCSVKNSTVNGGSSGAGIVGLAMTAAAKTMKIENCSVTGSTITSADNGDWRVGAIVGTVNGTGKLTVSNCTVGSDNTFTQTAGTDKTGYVYDKTNHVYGRATASNLIEIN